LKQFSISFEKAIVGFVGMLASFGQKILY